MSKIGNWFSLIAVSTVIIGLVYISGQQILRQSANDPQIQIAEDTANQLVNGTTLNGIMTSLSVDVTKSLAPFIIVYDANGNVQGSQALMDGKTPALPSGVLTYAKQYTQHRLTWQPKPGVRLAVVVQYFIGPNNTSGFVLAGRNIREVEKREDSLLFFAIYAWIAAFLVIGAGFVISGERRSKR